MFNNLFPKIAPLMRKCRKIWWRPRCHKYVTIWRIRVAFWISKATCTYTHAHARTHAHTDDYVIVTAFPRQQWFRTLLAVTLYVHCPLVITETERVYCAVRAECLNINIIKVNFYVQVGMVQAGLSPRRFVFDPDSLPVGFMVDRVALRVSFYTILWFLSVSIIPAVPHTHLYLKKKPLLEGQTFEAWERSKSNDGL